MMNTVRTTEREVSKDSTTVSDFFTRTEGRKNIEKSNRRTRIHTGYKSLDIVYDFLKWFRMSQFDSFQIPVYLSSLKDFRDLRFFHNILPPFCTFCRCLCFCLVLLCLFFLKFLDPNCNKISAVSGARFTHLTQGQILFPKGTWLIEVQATINSGKRQILNQLILGFYKSILNHPNEGWFKLKKQFLKP